jgi:hypothetical protein
MAKLKTQKPVLGYFQSIYCLFVRAEQVAHGVPLFAVLSGRREFTTRLNGASIAAARLHIPLARLDPVAHMAAARQ